MIQSPSQHFHWPWSRPSSYRRETSSNARATLEQRRANASAGSRGRRLHHAGRGNHLGPSGGVTHNVFSDSLAQSSNLRPAWCRACIKWCVAYGKLFMFPVDVSRRELGHTLRPHSYNGTRLTFGNAVVMGAGIIRGPSRQ